MNTIPRHLLALSVCLSLVGCAATPKDIKQANNYRMGLAAHLGLAPEQVTVAPGRGVAYVTISGVQLTSEKERIAADLTTINKNNPKLDKLSWSFK